MITNKESIDKIRIPEYIYARTGYIESHVSYISLYFSWQSDSHRMQYTVVIKSLPENNSGCRNGIKVRKQGCAVMIPYIVQPHNAALAMEPTCKGVALFPSFGGTSHHVLLVV